jgi:hypothetical protein
MNQAEAASIAHLSMRNRAQVEAVARCGCFHCQAVFAAADVRAWVDDGQTALCPRCDIDAVLPGITDADTLRSLHHHRFDVTVRPTEAGWRTAPADGAAGT